MMSGDEFYDDEVTSGLFDPPRREWIIRRHDWGDDPGPWQYVVSVRETIPGYPLDAWSSKLDPLDPEVKTFPTRGAAQHEANMHPSWRDAEVVLR